MKEAGVKAVFQTKVVIGPRKGIGPERENYVLIRLDRDFDGNMIWLSRCRAKSKFNPGIVESLDNAAKCAVYGLLDLDKTVQEPAF